MIIKSTSNTFRIMIYHHLRNATAVIETKTDYLLIDPMLGDVGSIEAFTQKRFPPKRNPLVELPKHTNSLLEKVTHVLVTHQHADHLDKAGIEFLKEKKLAITCSVLDAKSLKEKGLNVTQELDYNFAQDFLGGTIEGIPAQHGYGEVAQLMGNVMGFYIELLNEPSLYLASDTIFTENVAKVLVNYNPEISVIPCGSAQLDNYEPILMTLKDILKFANLNFGMTICNHLEAMNHCPTQRLDLHNAFKEQKLINKFWIPEDGEAKSLINLKHY